MLKLLLLLALPFTLISQGFQVNLQGQAQQGMGGAGAGLMQDGASLFFNPGGASFVHKNDISIGMTPTIANGTFLENKTNLTAKTTSPIGTPFTAYGLFQIKDSSRLKLGLAIYTPFGSTVEWEEGWSGRFALTRLQLLSVFFQPTISLRITDKIGLGAGFVYGYGAVNLQKDIPLQFQNGDYSKVELEGKGQGFGYNVGVYFEPTEHVGLGISYRSQVKMKITKGTATFTVPSSLEEKFPNGKFTSSLPLPDVFTLGLSIRPNSKLAIAIDANYIGWNSYDTLAFDYENNTESLLDTKSARNYVGAVAIRFGGQYKFSDRITARIGIAYGISPVLNGYVTPETPDDNRVNYTAGLGFKIAQNFVLDASLLFTQVTREDTNFETNLSGTFKTRVFAPGLSITYNL